MKIAYLNCSAGVAGDMLLAACVDAGLSPIAFSRRLQKALPIPFSWKLRFRRAEQMGWPGLSLAVEGDRRFSGPSAMKRVVDRSRLPAEVKRGALAVLDRLVRAEARAHRDSGGHWHELSCVDTVVDVAGTLLAVRELGIERLYASEVLVGRLAPASGVSLKGIPIKISPQADIETTTPTGAAILRQLGPSFGAPPLMRLSGVGYGVGTFQTPWPNVLSISLGTSEGPAEDGWTRTSPVLLETNIDDMDPRVYPYLIERLMGIGCLDAWLAPIVMKKGRPAHAVCALAPAPLASEAAGILFRETTTLGIRVRVVERWALPRRGRGRIKEADYPGGSKRSVEFEGALSRARRTGRPLRELLKP